MPAEAISYEQHWGRIPPTRIICPVLDQNLSRDVIYTNWLVDLTFDLRLDARYELVECSLSALAIHMTSREVLLL